MGFSCLHDGVYGALLDSLITMKIFYDNKGGKTLALRQVAVNSGPYQRLRRAVYFQRCLPGWCSQSVYQEEQFYILKAVGVKRLMTRGIPPVKAR